MSGDLVAGVMPKGLMWRFLRPLTNRPGMRCVNFGKYLVGSTFGDEKLIRQTLAEFSFLLDYVPNWKRIYLPGGLVQHQSFVPRAAANEVFRNQLEICQECGMPSFLAVLKRHRPDPFLMSHGVDGFSLALDFPVGITVAVEIHQHPVIVGSAGHGQHQHRQRSQ